MEEFDEMEVSKLQETELPPAQDRKKDFRRACTRVSAFFLIIMLIRELATGVIIALTPMLMEFGSTGFYIISTSVSALSLQILPSILAIVMLDFGGRIRTKYKKSPLHTKAMANFPAMYGASMTIRLVTLLLVEITGCYPDSGVVETVIQPNMTTAVVTAVLLVVIAPIFEEFIFRGAVLNYLKPYGNGLAVFVSALMFGIMHGNFDQFFYAFVLGIALGYIAIATNSLFTSTIMHAIFNSVAAVVTLLGSTDAVSSMLTGDEISDGDQLIRTFFAIFIVIVVATAVIGFISMIKKLRNIKKYRLPRLFPELTNPQKTLTLLARPTSIFSLLVTVDVFTVQILSVGVMHLLNMLLGG